jgi:hypothetical protein
VQKATRRGLKRTLVRDSIHLSVKRLGKDTHPEEGWVTVWFIKGKILIVI